MLKSVSAAILTVAIATVLFISPAMARDKTGVYTDAHRLTGSTSFYRPSLTDVASVRRMAGARGIAADIRKLLTDAGIPGTSDAVVAMLSSTE